jgi:hypothetical protein
MNNLAKVEEEQHKNRYYLMQSNKSTRKVTGNFHYTPTLLETTMMKKSLTETVLLSFTNLETQYAKVFSKTLLTGFQLVSYCRLFTRISSAFISYLK